MRENFLHYVWKYKKFDVANIKTNNNETISIVSVGTHNHDSGPDFFNAQLRIEDQYWAGNVEIHLKSSDWYVHFHQTDKAYDNVILHVVYEHDAEVFRKDNSVIPTLELKDYINKNVSENYKKLFSNHRLWINCETDFHRIDDFLMSHWMERLYFERLELKSKTIEAVLKMSNNNWEATLFKLLAKNFGLKVNGDAFYSVANSVDFSVVRKLQTKKYGLEALFFGQAGLLFENMEDKYYRRLKNEYQFLKQKFMLTNDATTSCQFFRLRPSNFPTIRLSQLASLYHKEQHLFSKIMETAVLKDFYKLFEVETSPYWKSHYTFSKVSNSMHKTLTKSFINLLLINTVLPLKFHYAKQQGITNVENILTIISQIASEKNSIVRTFNKLRPMAKSALESQALIQLKTQYCNQNQCLKCVIGNSLLGK